MSKSKLKKVATASKTKVSKAVKKPVKTVKKSAKAVSKVASKAKSEVVRSVDTRQCAAGLCKVTIFVLGMVLGALLFLTLTILAN
jgi:hypothetical protein